MAIQHDEYEDRRVRALFEMLSHSMAWETEPHAYLKEPERGSNYKEHNLIRERGYDFGAAIAEYLEMRIRLMGLFQRLRAEVEKDASDGVKAYIESGVRYYVGATT